MILPIYIYGNSVLRKQAQEITPDYPDLQTLIENMFETLTESDGVGLAAPQIGLDIRLVVIDLDVLSEDFPEYKDFKKVYINPHIVEYDTYRQPVIVHSLGASGSRQDHARPYCRAFHGKGIPYIVGSERRSQGSEGGHRQGKKLFSLLFRTGSDTFHR